MVKIFKIFLFLISLNLTFGMWYLSCLSSESGEVKWITKVYADQARTLHIISTPQEAIDDGAQWRVDGEAWRKSGATVSDLAVGEHTVKYKNVTGWNTLVSEIVTITENETTEITRSYIEQYVTTFCVSSAAELQAALTTASSNGEDDIIRIVQGAYNGNFTYASTEVNRLSIEKGYAEGCASREIDSTNTVLDGGGTDTVLALVSRGAAKFSVEGLTLQDGYALTVDDGGGAWVQGDALKAFFTEIRNPFGHGPGSAEMPELLATQTNWAIDNCMSWIKSLVKRM